MTCQSIEFRTLDSAEEGWFCPITKDKCDEKCMWIVEHSTIDEDGVDKYRQCAIAYFIGVLLDMNPAFYSLDEGE